MADEPRPARGHLAELGDWPQLEAAPYPGPVLWLAGSESSYVAPEYAPIMRALFPRVQLVTVKNTGHWVHSERPEIFVAAVRRFLHLEPHGRGTSRAATAARRADAASARC